MELWNCQKSLLKYIEYNGQWSSKILTKKSSRQEKNRLKVLRTYGLDLAITVITFFTHFG